MDTAIMTWEEQDNYVSLIPDELIENLNRLKSMGAHTALEVARQGCLSYLLSTVGLKLLWAHAHGVFYNNKISFDTHTELPQEVDVDSLYGLNGGYELSMVDFDGTRKQLTNGNRCGVKYKIQNYPNGIPFEALKKLPENLEEKAVIFDIVNLTDPILAYPIERKTYRYVKGNAPRFLCFNEEVGGWIKTETPLYASIYEWE